jgi:hypothetical protein
MPSKNNKKSKQRKKPTKKVPPKPDVVDDMKILRTPQMFEVGDYIRVQNKKEQIIDSGYLISIDGDQCEYYSSEKHKIEYTSLECLTQKPTVGDRIIHIDRDGAIDDIGFLIDTKKFMYTYYSAKNESVNTGIANEFETDMIPPEACESELIQKALTSHQRIQELKRELERLQKEYEAQRHQLRISMYETFDQALQCPEKEGASNNPSYGVSLTRLAECLRYAGKVSQISIKLPGYIRLAASFDIRYTPPRPHLDAEILFTTSHNYIVLPEKSHDYIQDLDLILRIRNAHDQILGDDYRVQIERIFQEFKLPIPIIESKQESGISVDPLFNAAHPTVSNNYTFPVPITPDIIKALAIHTIAMVANKQNPVATSSQ